LTSALDGGEWSASRPGRSNPGRTRRDGKEKETKIDDKEDKDKKQNKFDKKKGGKEEG
jgi:hypothetical protein